MSERQKRRWYQFSLWTLFVAMTLLRLSHLVITKQRLMKL